MTGPGLLSIHGRVDGNTLGDYTAKRGRRHHESLRSLSAYLDGRRRSVAAGVTQWHFQLLAAVGQELLSHDQRRAQSWAHALLIRSPTDNRLLTLLCYFHLYRSAEFLIL
jgi:hypothetical protein